MSTKFRIFKQIPRLIYGPGSIARLSELFPGPSDGYHVYIIDAGLKALGFANKLQIRNNDLLLWVDVSKHEPTTSQIDETCENIRKFAQGAMPSCIIGVGGGSAMDIAKATSVLLTNGGKAESYQGWDLPQKPGVFKLGIPTISGSGAEASRTAVLKGPEKKQGINSDFSMFDGLILDSELTATVPFDQRFYTAMDCYIHCVESLLGTMINELARAYAFRGLELCQKVYLNNGTNDELMTASFVGGVSIVNSEVGICHALSYGISNELGFRHGLANCIVFNVLEEYYGNYVNEFKSMLVKHKIVLPQNVTKKLDNQAIERMIVAAYRMEKPLTNALGPNWRDILTPEKIKGLYARM